MKKISLKNFKLDGADLLQRDQLKTVLGGNPPITDELPPEDINGGGSKCWAVCNSGINVKVKNCYYSAAACGTSGVLFCGCVV